MTTSLASTPGTFVHAWDRFKWENGGYIFSAHINTLEGFTGEHYDGEAMGLAIEGKSGQVLWFHIEDAIMCDDDHVDYWILAPTCSTGAHLGVRGRIYNG